MPHNNAPPPAHRKDPVSLSAPQPYSPLWLFWLIVAGIVDPLYGIVCKIVSIVWSARLTDRADSPARRRRGLAIVVGGIEGPSLYNLNMGRGVLKSRFRGAVVRYDWNAGVPFVRSLVNLMSPSHHERSINGLVRLIEDYQKKHQGVPVHIIAQSGGCWITIRALERLPRGASIQTAVLIAPSMSPGYDIRAAAERCDDAIISFGSAGDFFFLGMGTLLFGTSDRVFSPSSGLLGWHHQHERFIDARWHPSWLIHGNLGNHTTSAAQLFVKHVIARRLFTSEGATSCHGHDADLRLTVSTAGG